MHNLDIKFKGKKVKVNFGNTTAFSILPISFSKESIAYQDMFEKESEEECWRFSHESLAKKDDFFRVYLEDDGTIEYEDKDGKSKLPEKFDPKKTYDDKIGIIASDINLFKSAIEVKDKTGVDAEDILKLRKRYLDAKLRMLGFLSTESFSEEYSAEKGYYSLRRIAEELENYTGFEYVLLNNADNEELGYKINIPDNFSKDRMFKKAIKMASETDDIEKFMANEEIRKETTNNLLKDYRENMSQKVEPSDYTLYTEEVKKLARVLLGFNYDLLPEDQKEEIEDLTSLDGIEVQDKISEVIDSKNFAKACNIEDNFIISENRRYVDSISELGIDNDIVMATSIGSFLDSQRRETRMLTHERQALNDRYEEMKKLYDAKEIKFIIKENLDDLNARKNNGEEGR